MVHVKHCSHVNWGLAWILGGVLTRKSSHRVFLVTTDHPLPSSSGQTLRVRDLIIKVLPDKDQGPLEDICIPRIELKEEGGVHRFWTCAI